MAKARRLNQTTMPRKHKRKLVVQVVSRSRQDKARIGVGSMGPGRRGTGGDGAKGGGDHPHPPSTSPSENALGWWRRRTGENGGGRMGLKP